MNESTLEKLLMDDALGTLSPEVSELLAEYVRANPGAETEMKRWRDVTDTAQRALDSDQPADLPEFHHRQFRFARGRRIVGSALAAAAAVVIGVGIGRLWPASVPAGSQVVAIGPALVTQSPVSVGVHDFWSSQRLLASAAATRRSSSPAWLWTSPTKEPSLGAVQ